MKVLFAALHHAYYRNFDSVVRELVARGHRVHLAAEEPESLGGQGLAERLAAESPGAVTWDLMPSLEHEPWFDAAQRCRVALDYVRVLDPGLSAEAEDSRRGAHGARRAGGRAAFPWWARGWPAPR